MRRYRFPLAGVLRVRRLEEDRAKAALTGANADVAAADAALLAEKGRYRALSGPSGTMTATAFLASRARHEARAASVVFAADTRVAAGLAAAERREEYVQASQRVQVLERLDERRRAEHALEAQRAADKEVDDMVGSRYVRKGG